MRIRIGSHLRLFSAALLLLACFSQPVVFVQAQTETTGAFRGRVVDEAGAGLADATVRATNKLTGVPTATRTTADGYFTIGLLQPGDYTLTVLKGDIYDVRTRDQRLTAVDATTVLPEPFVLRKRTAIAAQPTPVPTGTQQPITQATPDATAKTLPTPEDGSSDIAIDINKRNARRGGVFTREEVSTLPLGATTLTRTFDELALLLPGVAPAPQTLGNIAGPGVGPGVGSAGQFAVNGLRSRSNNFTVDGSDNNDEDIGVRRQGFFALVPQPIESIQEYQVTTLLAPAQYGRNIGAQVNAVSKSGGNQMHGTFYGFLNSSQLNARNPFDFVGANTRIPLQGRALSNDLQTLGASRNVVLTTCTDINCTTQQLFVNNNSGKENSFTLVQGGFVLGGPLIRSDVDNYGSTRQAGDRRSLFYFISAEGQILNANQEATFAVPTVEERGIFRTGARGLFFDPLFADFFPLPFAQANNYPTTLTGDALFSFFPFPNNPGGIYGRNTYTTVLPANAQGKILSGKLNADFSMFGKPQEFVARYNFTDDWRDIPVTGGALFSSLRPRVRTQNFSTFLNTNLSGATSSRPVFNQLRASYGRTRLAFDEVRDTSYLLQSQFARSLPPGEQAFLLNARTLFNNTLPGDTVVSYAQFISNSNPSLGTTESTLNQFNSGLLTPVGQINIAGFSPVGVDVFNFPQRRVNNTYQLADTLTVQLGSHNLTFGADTRRTELNSDLPRNARPLLTFNAFPNFTGDLPVRNFFSGADLAAVGAPSGAFQALSVGRDATINLRYYQLNFFGQDEWRIRENLYLSIGLRYENNTVPKSANQKIERTFSATLPVSIRDLSQFIAGRRQIFEPDKNNFAPRIGIAYSPKIFGDRTSVFRAGAGIFYDQILGAVVSQSRNVFDTFLNTNFAGGLPSPSNDFNVFTPNLAFITCGGNPAVPLIQPGTLNTLNPAVPLSCFTNVVQSIFPSGFPATLPARNLETPTAYHYAFTFEQQLSNSLVLSAAYVGTQGRHLLRQTTPNQGSNALVFITDVDPTQGNTPIIGGIVRNPLGRRLPNIGGVTIFTSDANSRYDALQLQLRGRFGFLGSSSQFQASYTFSKAEDDVSDVFDMAGAPALPQNSLTFAGERAPANFDARHRFSWSYITDLSNWFRENAFGRFLFKGTQIAGDGFFQTGQPFTVNTIFDVNLDGNLTDRLDNTNGIRQTGDRSRPLVFNGSPPSVLARLGEDGRIPRNSFRAGNLLLTNVALIKNFDFGADNGKRLSFRMDVFNVFNRANYGIPVRYLEFPGFGQATDTVTPSRRIQFALKYSF